MKDINLDEIIAKKRRERGVTQEELARHMGVSKASVSKWENRQSYPDITLLPRLASYFHVSIDELMGYSPQLTEEEIDKLFLELSQSLAGAGADETMAACRILVRRYASCFPLLLRMALFYINRCSMLKEKDGKRLLEEASCLCSRMREECTDIYIRRQAAGLEAACELLLDRPEHVLELLGRDARVLAEDERQISMAYLNMGDREKAGQVIQVSIYQHMNAAVDYLISYLYLNMARPETVEKIWDRLSMMIDVFHLERLRPAAALQAYMMAAAAYSQNGDREKAMAFLHRYEKVCLQEDAARQRGDDFFDAVEDWMARQHMDSMPMRSQRAIQEELLAGMLEEPVFKFIKDDPDFKAVVKRIKKKHRERKEKGS